MAKSKLILGLLILALAGSASAAGYNFKWRIQGASVSTGIPVDPGALTKSSVLLDFSIPATLVGNQSAENSVSISNTGPGPVVISGIVSSSASWLINHNCPVSLGSGQSCSIGVRFSPTVAGTNQAGQVIIDSNSVNGQERVDLVGTAEDPVSGVSLSDGTWAFADQLINTSSSPKGFTLTNTGMASLTIGALGITGGTGFSLGSDLCSNTSIAPGGTCTFQVSFAPVTLGSHSGRSVQVPSNAPGSPHAVTLGGSGVGVPTITQGASTLAFGATEVGQSKNLGHMITNSGTAPLQVTGVSFDNPAYTLVTNGCSNVAPAGTCNLSVQFAPTASGAISGIASIASNDPAQPSLSLNLTGTGASYASLHGLSATGGNIMFTSGAGLTTTVSGLTGTGKNTTAGNLGAAPSFTLATGKRYVEYTVTHGQVHVSTGPDVWSGNLQNVWFGIAMTSGGTGYDDFNTNPIMLRRNYYGGGDWIRTYTNSGMTGETPTLSLDNSQNGTTTFGILTDIATDTVQLFANCNLLTSKTVRTSTANYLPVVMVQRTSVNTADTVQPTITANFGASAWACPSNASDAQGWLQ